MLSGSGRPEPPERDGFEVRLNWMERRRAKIAEEIARNRRGEHTVPTWVLAVALVAVLGGWITLIVLS